jgi:acid phosphatase family membrane protein YuiD
MLESLKAIISNEILIVPLFGWIISQTIKFIINLIVEKKFDFKRLFGDGGMPSGHSAMVSGVATMCALLYGFSSPYFAIATVLALIVMHDAIGVRREAGKHAISIKELAEAFNKTFTGKTEEIRTENLKLFVGHTPLQVFLGSILGITISCVYFFFIK